MNAGFLINILPYVFLNNTQMSSHASMYVLLTCEKKNIVIGNKMTTGLFKMCRSFKKLKCSKLLVKFLEQ